MSVATGTAIKEIFTTASPSSGAAADADSLPTGVLWVDGVANAATVTIADATGTGRYTFAVTMPTLTTGQRVSVVVDATIGGVGCAGKVWEDVADNTVASVKAVTDQLDVSSVTQVAASSAGHLTITAGLTFSEAVTGLTIPADWVAAVWTLKYSPDQADTAAVAVLRTENPAAVGDGLQRLNGAAVASPITAADGVLTVTQASGRIDIWLSDELTVLLAKATGLGWDIKFIDEDGDSSGRRGTADVVLTETKTVT